MTKLNQIELMWFIKDWKNRNLESSIKHALSRWDAKKDTRDIIPEFVIFHTSHRAEIEQDEILGLQVVFENNIVKKHFKIRGTYE